MDSSQDCDGNSNCTKSFCKVSGQWNCHGTRRFFAVFDHFFHCSLARRFVYIGVTRGKPTVAQKRERERERRMNNPFSSFQLNRSRDQRGIFRCLYFLYVCEYVFTYIWNVWILPSPVVALSCEKKAERFNNFSWFLCSRLYFSFCLSPSSPYVLRVFVHMHTQSLVSTLFNQRNRMFVEDEFSSRGTHVFRSILIVFSFLFSCHKASSLLIESCGTSFSWNWTKIFPFRNVIQTNEIICVSGSGANRENKTHTHLFVSWYSWGYGSREIQLEIKKEGETPQSSRTLPASRVIIFFTLSDKFPNLSECLLPSRLSQPGSCGLWNLQTTLPLEDQPHRLSCSDPSPEHNATIIFSPSKNVYMYFFTYMFRNNVPRCFRFRVRRPLRCRNFIISLFPRSSSIIVRSRP